MSFEVELPRVEDNTSDSETFAVGFTPTRSGDYITALLVKSETAEEPTEA